MVLVARVRWASQCKDAGSPDSGAIGATEDAASRRPARPGDSGSFRQTLLLARPLVLRLGHVRVRSLRPALETAGFGVARLVPAWAPLEPDELGQLVVF